MALADITIKTHYYNA